MSANSCPRIAIYSQDGFGLGHLRRNSVIGQHLLEALPKSKVLLFADSPVAPFFQLPQGMDHIKLPSIKKCVLIHGSRARSVSEVVVVREITREAHFYPLKEESAYGLQ